MNVGQKTARSILISNDSGHYQMPNDMSFESFVILSYLPNTYTGKITGEYCNAVTYLVELLIIEAQIYINFST
jgi:hypothetical protein